jgi:probable rRNA maturation factor
VSSVRKNKPAAGCIELSIHDLQKTIPLQSKRIKNLARAVLKGESADKPGKINICFVGAGRIRRLNRIYHCRNAATDVLAFDLAFDTDEIICDIFISTQAAVLNSRIYKTTPAYETHLYVVHGLLHILGYNDRNLSDRAVMRRKEKEYLKLKWLY